MRDIQAPRRGDDPAGGMVSRDGVMERISEFPNSEVLSQGATFDFPTAR
jgi:hypothetical protein